MQLRLLHTGFLLILLHFWTTSLRADSTSRSKLGIDLRALKPNLQQAIGWSAGVRGAYYLGTSNAFLGLSGYFGTPQGGNPKDEHLWYTGLSLGYEGRISKLFIWETSLLGGLGAGKSLNLNQQSYYVVEPSVGIGFQLGGGYKLTFNISYVHMTSASQFSGPTFGFRIDHKTQTTTKDLND